MSDLVFADAPGGADAVAAAPVSTDFGSVAIVHDYLNQPGGAERVVLALAAMWPDAPIYTSLYRVGSTFPDFGGAEIRTSALDLLPVDHGFRNLFPLYPAAFRSLGTLDHDLVISSSSGWAHSVQTTPRTFHAVYCHAPARWLYGGEHMPGARRQALRPFLGAMRSWDRAAARRADLVIANSREVQRRIRATYGLEAEVVYPPVDVGRFTPTERGDRLLVVCRLLPYKRIDAIVDTATRAGIGLDVVGTGPALEDLRQRAGACVTFHGRLEDDDVSELIHRCRALCVPGKEDFGIVSVEAIAAGKPVVALAAGGALETVEEGVTGAFFTSHTPDAILGAIRRCDVIDLAPTDIAVHARRFSRREFELRLTAVLAAGMKEHRARPARRAQPRPLPAPRPLMLGKGWFPHQLGGLDRYYRDLLTHLPEAAGIVVGSDADVPAAVRAVSRHDHPLPRRLLAVWRAAQRAAADCDVVDAHFALYAVAVLRIGRLRHKPVIVHFHGPWARENIALGDRSRARHAARALLERLAYHRADQVVVMTSAFRQVLVERYGVSPWRVNVVPPGVDLARFSPGSHSDARAALGLPSESLIAVAVRRLEPRMGLDVLLDAWAAIADDLPPGSTLLIAGDGRLRASLEADVTARGLEGSVRILGRVSDEQLVTLYRAADVAVVPTREHEGFGLVVIEAAACGTPSIVTSVGGLPEAIGGLDKSLIVSPADAQALGDRLLRARNDLPTRAEARTYAERFEWSAVAERHRDIARRAAGTVAAPRRLRVVYLDHVARLSGGEIALMRLLPHLSHVDPHVILAEDGPLVQQLHLAGISTEILPLNDATRHVRKGEVHRRAASPAVAAGTAAYIVRLAARLRRLRPDLVHTNSLKAGVYGSLAARLAGLPVVWHVRDRIAPDYLPAPAVTLVRMMSGRLATAVVANSRTTMDTLRGRRAPLVIYSVLPEVLTEVAPRRRTHDGPLTFGIVGRLAPWKGQDFFLRAFARAFPDGDERAVIVGGALFGEGEFAAEVAALTHELGISDRVELRGHRLDVWDELSRIDVLVHASQTPEPFGQVVLEGMAAGVPVIAAGAGGPAEILEHGVTGILYAPRDVHDLAEAMWRMRERALRDRLSATARDALGPYSPPVVAAQLQELYDAVAARRRPRV